MSGMYASKWATPATESKPKEEPTPVPAPEIETAVAKDDGTAGEDVSEENKTEEVEEKAESKESEKALPEIPEADTAKTEKSEKELPQIPNEEKPADDIRETLIDVSEAAKENVPETPMPVLRDDEDAVVGAEREEEKPSDDLLTLDQQPLEPTPPESAEKPATPVQDVPEIVQPAEAPKPDEVEPDLLPQSPAKTPVPEFLKGEATQLLPPRLKTRISWKDRRTLAVCIPDINFELLGLPVPLSFEQVAARMKSFEDAGFNTSGFDVDAQVNEGDNEAHVKPIWPNETDVQTQRSETRPSVLLPDRRRWEAYMDWLTEQKLAALGVGTASEEPVFQPAVSVASQDMSRQSSAQYPPLPFSPPVPASSASSVSRPGVTRGHSTNMSVSSPLSPVGGAFGHMHRHSVLGGPPMPFSLPQSMAGSQAFSPIPQVGSPAQLGALRQDYGFNRVASPQQPVASPAPAGPGASLIEEHIRRQSVQLPPGFNPFMPNNSVPVHQTPALPELPEEDDEDLQEPQDEQEQDEEEEPSTPVYVPPQKRSQFSGEIAVPTPRGHRHNISEGLERDILAAEKRHEAQKRDWIEVEEEEESSSGNSVNGIPKLPSFETDPLGSDLPVQESKHNRKKSAATRFNVNAPKFQFNPQATFQPANTAFTFTAPTANGFADKGHIRQTSSGNFNAAAAEFRPGGNAQPDFQFGQTAKPQVPKSDFNFSTQGPSFRPGAIFEPPPPQHKGSVDGLPSIFGKVEIPDIVKPPRRSKAITIVRPEDFAKSASGTDVEDSEGRIAQSEDRLKRARKQGDDGDEVPQFAVPTPMPNPANFLPKPVTLPSNGTPKLETANLATQPAAQEEKREVPEQSQTAKNDDLPSSPAKPADGWRKGHKSSGSLSALARPFQPAIFQPVGGSQPRTNGHTPYGSIGETEEGEIKEQHPVTSPIRAPGPVEPDAKRSDFIPPNNEDAAKPADAEPSFAEIDAVMEQLNELDNDAQGTDNRSISPLPPSPGSHPLKGVTYLPERWPRSDAPSPSPKRVPYQTITQDSSFSQHNRTDSGENPNWAHVNRLNRNEEVPTSDWSGMLSPPDEEKLLQRSNFFDSRIDEIIGRVVERRLQPLEDSLRSIEYTVSKRTRSVGGRSVEQHSVKRSESTMPESDADDEDDVENDSRRRPISRGRDKRVDQIKAAVLEALREKSPKPAQAENEISELHTVLADMKMSFARAASGGLDLEDIKAAVEQSVTKHNESVRAAVEETVQSQQQAVRAMVEDHIAKSTEAAVQDKAEGHKREEAHKRELSEMEGRMNETLAGALEEANRRRAAEEREIEAKRQLRLIEDELKILRDTSRDGDSRVNALAGERRELLDRVQKAESKNEAMEAERKGLIERADQIDSRVSEMENERRELVDRIDDLQEGKAQSEERVETLEKENKTLKESLEELGKSGGKFHERVQSLEAENLAMSKTLDEYRKSSDKWRQYNEDAKEARQRLEQRIEELREDIDATERDKSELEDTVQQLRLEAEQAKKGKHEYETAYTEVLQNLEIARTANDELEGAVSSLRHAAEEATRQRDDLEWTIGNLQQNLGDGKRQRAEYDINVSALRSEVEDNKAEKQALQKTIDELRRDMDEVKAENEDLENAVAGLERQLEEGQEATDGMKRRLEKLHSDMATAAGQLASEKATWKAKEEDARQWREALEAQHAADVKERYALEEELRTLKTAAAEATEAKANLEQLRLSNSSLEEIVRKLQTDLVEQQSAAARFEREFHDARESGRAEVIRTRMALETDVEAANHQVNIVRAELEMELSRVRNELDNAKQEAEMAKARRERMLEDEEQARREVLRKVNHANSVALEEARQKHDATLRDVAMQHQRALDHAIEDKGRSEAFLMERLTLSEEKLKHYQDRVEHLEERLQVAKAAAHAAAASKANAPQQMHSRGMPSSGSHFGMPEKISPQALRESILVLQEQLQDREVQLDKLRNQVNHEGPAKIKERDTEISWLRELLTVRSEELGELVDSLSEDNYDPESVRDAAIRIRANLDMQLQERERFGQSSSSLGNQALASLQSFATPRLSSAFSKWRSAMENPALKAPVRKSSTPSRRPPAIRQPPSYMSGLMTPPASNLRNTPSPDVTKSVPAPRLQSRKGSMQSVRRPSSSRGPQSEPPAMKSARQASNSSNTSASRLFREQNYDRDAQDREVHLPTFEEDEDLDVETEAAPTGFRSLEDELDEPSDSGAADASDHEEE